MGQKVISMETKLRAVLARGSYGGDRLWTCVPSSRSPGRRSTSTGAAGKPRARPGLTERSLRPRRRPRLMSAEVEDEIVRLRSRAVRQRRADDRVSPRSRWLVGAVGRDDPSSAGATRPGRPHPQKRPGRRGDASSGPDQRRVADRRHPLGLADGREGWIMDILDDHSRLLSRPRCVAARPHGAWDAFSTRLDDWGVPAHVMSDNGTCFTGRFIRRRTEFERDLRTLGVHTFSPRPPIPRPAARSNGSTRR